MKLTGLNTRFDQNSGAILVEQSEELQLLMQILNRLELIEEKINALMGEGTNDGGSMANK